MKIKLSKSEFSELMKQDPSTRGDGGWQSLLVGLQEKVDKNTGELTLTVSDIERIGRYAFDYGNGGWEDTLQRIFGSHLGTKLGRI